MESLNIIENENSHLLWGSSQDFNECEYEELNSQIQKEKSYAKKQDEVKRNELMVKLFGDETDKLSTSETWREIEWYLQEFQNNPEFLVANGLSDNILTEIINSEDRLKVPLIYQAAALLLLNIGKWASPYCWLAGMENRGLWIRVLLGKDHYNQFMIDKENCIADIQNGSWVDRSELQGVLSTCEMDYIINNIRWSNWKHKYFWCHLSKWRDGVIIPNEFADRLESFSKWWFSKSSVEKLQKSV